MSSNITGTIFDIKKFAIHDGPGIRTTVFLKGCPLRCIWCHNPESMEAQKEISFIPDKCIGCGYCFQTCPKHCHEMMKNDRVYHRENCIVCGECTTECYAQALEVIGKEVGIEEVIEEVMKDQPFYETSGGGMTISGGEPMMQFEFTKALLEEAKKHKLHTCLDTSGVAPYERYHELLGLVDIFLYDIKETDTEKHLEFTGVPLELISENLKKIDKAGGKTVLRCPLIPGLNVRDEHLKKIAAIASELENVIEIDLHPYHPLGKSKSDRIGKEYSLKEQTFPEEAEVERWKSLIESLTNVPVKRG